MSESGYLAGVERHLRATQQITNERREGTSDHAVAVAMLIAIKRDDDPDEVFAHDGGIVLLYNTFGAGDQERIEVLANGDIET